jgi:hypothetical protein
MFCITNTVEIEWVVEWSQSVRVELQIGFKNNNIFVWEFINSSNESMLCLFALFRAEFIFRLCKRKHRSENTFPFTNLDIHALSPFDLFSSAGSA